ncbi:hypothetical protein Ppro_1112 [Pelobacter propionicus DSM 2379]|uniref:Uncharacterized protein n=1 Tax=Pelobacter propionicus (strain DSM 2379 / NBRC 103807 / OttBd1) TaxID=338966 RepID=A1AN16_PELPD|nr:hypothetical protein Ppro_1112 [Pelobacter propionicus DSM 2379]
MPHLFFRKKYQKIPWAESAPAMAAGPVLEVQGGLYCLVQPRPSGERIQPEDQPDQQQFVVDPPRLFGAGGPNGHHSQEEEDGRGVM